MAATDFFQYPRLLAAINAWILYTETTEERLSRQDFLLNLAENLSADYTEECHQRRCIFRH